MQTFLSVMALVGAVLSLILGAVAVYDFVISTRIRNRVQSTLPVKLRRSLTYTQFECAIDRVQVILDEIRFVPDIVVGIHYQGLCMASLIAKTLYKPVVRAEIVYKSEADKHVFESLSFDFDAGSQLAKKKVLIVDNSMISGATLRAVKMEVEGYTQEILTLVVYDKDRDHPPKIDPDITLFASSRPKRLLR